MKRSLIIILFLLVLSNWNIFWYINFDECKNEWKIFKWVDIWARNDEYICINAKDIPEWNNKEDMYEIVRQVIKSWTWIYYSRGSLFEWRIEYEELIKYYLDNHTENKEEKEIYSDILFMEYFWSILTLFDRGSIYDTNYQKLINLWQRAIVDLDKYWRDNKNYDYFLGRYAFFLWIWYYYEKDYKKAIEYISIAHDRYKIEFKFPDNFLITNKTSDYTETIDIKIWDDLINTDFYSHWFTYKIRDFWNGWSKIDWKYRPNMALQN